MTIQLKDLTEEMQKRVVQEELNKLVKEYCLTNDANVFWKTGDYWTGLPEEVEIMLRDKAEKLLLNLQINDTI